MRIRPCLVLGVPLFVLACAGGPAQGPAAGSTAAAPGPTAPAAASASSAPAAASAPPVNAPPWFEGCLSAETVAATLECKEGTRVVPFEVLARAQTHIYRRPVPKVTPSSQSKDPKARLAPIPFDADEQALLGLRRDFVCTSQYGTFGGLVDQKMAVTYDLARTYFEKNRFEEAAVVFRVIALDAPEPAMEAPYAAQLFLEALNVLAGALEKPGCMGTLRAHVPLLLARLCTPSQRDERAEACRQLESIQAELAARKPAP